MERGHCIRTRMARMKSRMRLFNQQQQQQSVPPGAPAAGSVVRACMHACRQSLSASKGAQYIMYRHTSHDSVAAATGEGEGAGCTCGGSMHTTPASF